MKIYTKRGDKGETDLFGGQRVKKNHVRVKAYADIDAANCAIGLAECAPDAAAEIKVELLVIMKQLFCAGSEIATASKKSAQEILEKRLSNRISHQHVHSMEEKIDNVEKRLKPLTTFILPGGSECSARLHLARVMVRRVEASLLDLMDCGEAVSEEILCYFNRLSDYLFVLARLNNQELGVVDIPWSGELSA